MPMKRCDNGHFYDTAKHASCPSCGVVGVPDPKTSPRRSADTGGDLKTVAVIAKKAGIDPVVGWLICVRGPSKGKDYRLHTEKNFIGRSPEMDVAIAGDETLSRENHAVVSFNPKNATFKLLPGEGRGLVYCNSEEIDRPTELKKNDRIEIGQTELMFFPLCSADFRWDD